MWCYCGMADHIFYTGILSFISQFDWCVCLSRSDAFRTMYIVITVCLCLPDACMEHSVRAFAEGERTLRHLSGYRVTEILR